MALTFLFTTVLTGVFGIALGILTMLRRLSGQDSKTTHPADRSFDRKKPNSHLAKSLATALKDVVILPDHTTAFKQWTASYFAKQATEVMPACVVQPRNLEELCLAVNIIKHKYDEERRELSDTNRASDSEAIFAVRSGGHFSVAGASNIEQGIVIDMCHFCEITPSEDGTVVVIGVGARWGHVSKILDEKGLAVVGGRASDVGVGGYTLGGGISFFSPRFGLSCSNVLSYEVVLASGSVTNASASTNSDLWRALKGGSNNFGVVTRITFRSFPSSKIWSGFLYLPMFQYAKVLTAFHDFVSRDNRTGYSEYAAGPLTCFTYFQPLGIEIICVGLAYTKIPEDGKKWPKCWSTSSFKQLWRYWSTCKVRTLKDAADEFDRMDVPGQRQAGANITIKNDPTTLAVAHRVYRDSINSIRHIKGMTWNLVLQPLHPNWLSKGDPNPLGLQDCDQPLVNVSFALHWFEKKDDSVAQKTARSAMEEIEAFSVKNNTSHPYKYMNYCAGWQKPFEGYGEDNLKFLQGVSRKYDPQGLFQNGCVGGFKLGKF